MLALIPSAGLWNSPNMSEEIVPVVVVMGSCLLSGVLLGWVQRVEVGGVLGRGVVRDGASDGVGLSGAAGGFCLAAVDDDLLDLGQAVAPCGQVRSLRGVGTIARGPATMGP
ncbi:hypothetical protein [Mariniluteicoccus flavus]